MNENSRLSQPTIDNWLRDAAEQLANVGIASALLDAEIILAHTLRKSRTWLHAHGDEGISERELEIADARLRLRLDRTPIAYIIGHKEFYTRLFKVTPSVLIPRPESENIINLLKQTTLRQGARLIDVGTGSGCLGVTAKLELPHLDITLSDISRPALTVATENASNLEAEVATIKSDLLAEAPGMFDVILANLPYVDRSWERSPETAYEPELALFADKGGTELIDQLLQEATKKLLPQGYIFIEADPEQHNHIISTAHSLGFAHLATADYILQFQHR